VSLASDLLDQASTLAELDPMKPKQASLRRAISAAYYLVFHLLMMMGHGALRLMPRYGLSSRGLFSTPQ
jgi:hypothetical protein